MSKKLLFLFALSLSAGAQADYFLQGGQMADLIKQGQMTGEDGARYDVWIVPGYIGPAQDAADGWREAGHDLASYGQAGLYYDVWNNSAAVLDFAGHNTIGQFALAGSASAWREALGAAQGRVERRVFGWWFAYPWAVLEASGESVLRLGLGLPAGVVIGAAGGTLAPVATFAWPAAKSVYHGVGKGTLLPLAAASWNTVIAPPLALLGQQPARERADGFWLKRLDPQHNDDELQSSLAALRQWRQTASATAEAQALHNELKALRREMRERRQRLQRALDEEQASGERQLASKKLALLTQKAQQDDAFPAGERQQLRSLLQRHGRQPAIAALRGDGLSEQQADSLLSQLLGPLPLTPVQESSSPELRADAEKTDPLRRRIQLLGGSLR